MKLSEYVYNIMHAKGMSARDVAKKSKTRTTRGISHGYIQKITQGEEAMNLSVEKLRSLAMGLGVSEDELFDVARGKPAKLPDKLQQEVKWITEVYCGFSPIERERFKIMTETFLHATGGNPVHVRSKNMKQ